MARMTNKNRARLAELRAAKARSVRLAQAKNGKPLIEDQVLQKIASLGLPNNPWLYNLVLRELTREYSDAT